MKIVIVGAGKVGVALTRHLSVDNKVTVIDQNPHLVENIINIYDVMGVCGNGASYDVQKEADVEHTELLIATTSSDEINILTCLVAKKLGVHHTIARIRNPEYSRQLRFMRSELGLSMAINPEAATAREIARLCALPGLEAEGMFTHFADADSSEEYTMAQLTKFLDAKEALALAADTMNENKH